MTLAMDAGTALTASVAMHVAWNLLARTQRKEASPIWWVLLGHLVLLAPWGVAALIREATWSNLLVGILIVSASANATYFLGLDNAYRRAPVALVYPLVRSSPLLIAVWGVLLFDQSYAVGVWLGIGISVLGLLLMASTGTDGNDRAALPWTMLAMLATSVYSISDKAATALLPSFSSVVGFISIGYFTAWLSLSASLRIRTGCWMPKAKIGFGAMAIGGLFIGLAYALTIHAMRSMPAAEAVAYTNAGIVIASILSIFVFKERTHWKRRLTGGLVICSGLFIIGLARM